MIRYATLPDGTAITLYSLRDAVAADAAGHDDPEHPRCHQRLATKAEKRTAQLLAAKAYIDLDQMAQAECSRTGTLFQANRCRLVFC